MAPRSARAQRAMAHLLETDPALAALALWCRTEDAAGRTRTAGEAILIGDEFADLPLREQVGLLGRQILHIALRHDGRMRAMAGRLGGAFHGPAFSLAADAIVNECLEEAGHAMPRPAATLTRLSAEVLRVDPPLALSEWDVERLYLRLDALDPEGKGRMNRYAAATGHGPQDDEEDDAGAGAEEGDEADWRGRLTRALAAEGAAGRGIGGVLARIAALPRAETPWELRLRRLLANAAADRRRVSHRRPRRAWIAAEAEARERGGPTPVFEPGLSRDARRPRIVVGLDSSGSVSDAILSLFAAEVAGVARRTGAETHVLFFDETVYRRAALGPGSWEATMTAVEFQREGGTSFVDVIDQAAAMDPAMIVVLTDLDGPFGERPKAPVLWATPCADWPDPPFGQVLSLAR